MEQKPVAAPAEKKRDSNHLSSEENRKDLKYQTTLTFVGAEYGSNSPLTVSAGIFLNPNNIISLRYSNLNKSDGYEVEKLRAITLGYRHFLGNSFNIMPTAYWRRTKVDNNEPSNSIFFGRNPHFIYEDVGAGLRVGNEWQWEHLTMGCDWIGLNMAFKVLNKDEKQRTLFDNTDLKKAVNLTALSFYLGYSF